MNKHVTHLLLPLLIASPAAYADGHASQPIDLSGEWVADGYGCYDEDRFQQLIQISVNNGYVAASKLDAGGDSCVPTGSVTFFGFVGSAVQPGDEFKVMFVLGAKDAPASRVATDVDLVIVDEDNFSTWSGDINFARATPEEITE